MEQNFDLLLGTLSQTQEEKLRADNEILENMNNPAFLTFLTESLFNNEQVHSNLQLMKVISIILFKSIEYL